MWLVRTLDDQVRPEDTHGGDTDAGLCGTVGGAEAREDDGGHAAHRSEERLLWQVSTYPGLNCSPVTAWFGPLPRASHACSQEVMALRRHGPGGWEAWTCSEAARYREAIGWHSRHTRGCTHQEVSYGSFPYPQACVSNTRVLREPSRRHHVP